MFNLKNVRYKEILEIGDLSIPAGSVTCLVGESGSGKTTLLRHLNNLVSPQEGAIFYGEHNLTAIDPVRLRRRVVMLPQNPVIFPGSIRENLLAGLRFAEETPVSDANLTPLLNRFNLHKELDEDASRLSGGEKQRLAICRMLLLEPEVLLLDEPTSALDEQTEETAIQEVLISARQGGKTVVMVTHSPRLAHKYGEMVVTLQDGKIAQIEEGAAGYE